MSTVSPGGTTRTVVVAGGGSVVRVEQAPTQVAPVRETKQVLHAADVGLQGPPGRDGVDGAAAIPEILDGGNF